VLVAGGGPVGMVAALLLARWGVPSVVLEAAPERVAVGSRSICVQRDVLDVYHRVGVADALMARGVTWRTGRTYHQGRELFSFTFPELGRSAYPGFINIAQTEVEQALEVAVRGQPLIDFRYGHQVVAVTPDDSGVTVDIRTRDSGSTLRGTHVIAADGARSAVRSALGIEFEGRSFDDKFLIADVRTDLGYTGERRFHFDPTWNPGRQVLVHPQPDSVWRIDFQVPADYDLEAERRSGELDARIRRVTGDAGYETVWLSVYRFHQRRASTMRVGRVLLAGDAAHLMAPFGARGLNSGVQDAENAAWKIAFDRRGWAGPGLLASYEAERGAAAAENLRVTGATMAFLCPSDDSEWGRRRAALAAAATDPTARAAVDSGKLAEPFWYTESPLTTGEPPADFPRGPGSVRPPIAGVLCPDGPIRLPDGPAAQVPGRSAVRVPDGPAVRLRELFGDGFVLLAGSDVDPAGLATGGTAGAPVATYLLKGIDEEGIVSAALGAGPAWLGLVRPDGHLAAVLDAPDATTVHAALDRARGAHR